MNKSKTLLLKEVIAILAPYGIVKVTDFQLLSGGSENSNFLVKTPTRDYVLTICEQKSFEEAENLARLLGYLRVAGFKTSVVVKSLKQELVTTYKTKPVMVKEFLEGEILEHLSLEVLEFTGGELARLHQIPPPKYLPTRLGYGIETFKEVQRYAAETPFAVWLANIEKIVKPILTKKLPKSLIHSDLFHSNIIIDQTTNTACIMDFEEAAYYYRVFDIGMTIVGLCSQGKQIDRTKMKWLLKGYNMESPLQESEKSALKTMTMYAASAMCFWRHRNFNYTIPNEDMKDHYQELQAIAEDIKQIPEEFFLS